MLISPKVIIFDLDGTLIDSSASILAGFAAALDDLKIAPKLPLTATVIGPPLRETLAGFAGQFVQELLRHRRLQGDNRFFGR